MRLLLFLFLTWSIHSTGNALNSLYLSQPFTCASALPPDPCFSAALCLELLFSAMGGPPASFSAFFNSILLPILCKPRFWRKSISRLPLPHPTFSISLNRELWNFILFTLPPCLLEPKTPDRRLHFSPHGKKLLVSVVTADIDQEIVQLIKQTEDLR